MITTIVISCLGDGMAARHIKEGWLWLAGKESWDEDRRVSENVVVVVMPIIERDGRSRPCARRLMEGGVAGG